ncbi:MAG TPA: hypothetical protein PKU99_02815 [Candidatus Saccharicenans sp.]|nr:hypothetical protein [Candidatus Saccharicenans sp.]
MAESFTKRHGYGPHASGPIYEDAPEKLRIGLWNLIQDYVRNNNLPDYESLYLKITSWLKIKRQEMINPFREIEYLIITKLEWYQLFELIERFFDLIVFYGYDEGDYRRRVIPEQVGKIRYDYTVEINRLFEDENIGWRLKKGQLERIGPNFLETEVIQKTRDILKNQVFAGPNNQFNKAIWFLSKRPDPDLENCVKEAVGALEGVARLLINDKTVSLGKAVDKLNAMGKIRKPFDKIFHVLYGFASNEPGVRHAAVKPSNMSVPEASFVLYSSAVCILFLCETFGYKPIEQTAEHPDPEDDDCPY